MIRSGGRFVNSEEPMLCIRNAGYKTALKPRPRPSVKGALPQQFASVAPHVDNCCTCALWLLSNLDPNFCDRYGRQHRVLPVLYLGGNAVRIEKNGPEDLRRRVASRLNPETAQRQ